ncbi:MAG: anti-sigma factor [Dehalococcoidia bacterium]|nr:anti-sigma factor [Dehalococcoidia bacterium]
MKEHATHWLGAYLDGELRGLRLRWVEGHLEECAVCGSELEALVRLRTLLLESPAMEAATPPERFVAQVALRLPRRQEQPPAQRALELSWRMVPVGLLFTLAFVQTAFTIAGVLQVALSMGLGGEVGELIFPGAGVSLPDVFSLSQASLATAVGSVVELIWAGGALAWLPVSYLSLLVVIGLLYWSWLATWWARRRHQLIAASDNEF